MSEHLNAYRPDPDLEYEDPRLREAARHAYAAERMGPQHGAARAARWRQCLEITMAVADEREDITDHETSFALQLALRAAIECQRYGDATDIATRIIGRSR